MLKKMPGLDKSKEDSRSITTIQVKSKSEPHLKKLCNNAIQGRGGKEKTPNSNGAQVRYLVRMVVTNDFVKKVIHILRSFHSSQIWGINVDTEISYHKYCPMFTQ